MGGGSEIPMKSLTWGAGKKSKYTDICKKCLMCVVGGISSRLGAVKGMSVIEMITHIFLQVNSLQGL